MIMIHMRINKKVKTKRTTTQQAKLRKKSHKRKCDTTEQIKVNKMAILLKAVELSVILIH